MNTSDANIHESPDYLSLSLESSPSMEPSEVFMASLSRAFSLESLMFLPLEPRAAAFLAPFVPDFLSVWIQSKL